MSRNVTDSTRYFLRARMGAATLATAIITILAGLSLRTAAAAGPTDAPPTLGTPAPTNAPSGPVATSPQVVFGGAPLPSTPATAPYRDPADGEICVALRSLAPLGVTYIADAKAGVATIAGPDRVTVVTVPLRTPPGNAPGVEGRSGDFVAAVAVIEGLGGKCEWVALTNTLMARAVLTSVEMLGGQLRIKATLPVTPTITDEKKGRRVVIDVVGAEIGKLPHTIDLQSPTVATTHTGQFQSDIARIVLDMKQPYAFSVLGGKPGLEMILNPTVASPAPTAPAPISITIPAPINPPTTKAIITASSTSHSAPRRTGAHGKVTPPPPVSIVSGVTFHKVSDNEAQFLISANRAPTIRAALAKGRLTLDLLNSTLGSKAADLATFDHPFLRAVHLVANGSLAAQLVVDLTRTVVFTVRPSEKGPIELDLSLPRGAVGKLAGKTVVVDPGHGGHDSGARGVNGTSEKSVNLQIARFFADELRDAGANVIMTRSSDYFIPVDDRPEVANRAGADFFVSIHSDSGDSNHSIQGSTVYYHFNQPSCRALAQSIADRLAQAGDIHSRGIGSDGIRFPGQGFGVLRNSRMVAVLCECGYMSNGDDVRKLNTEAAQRKIAQSLVAGLRDYIEGNPNLDTRNVNPKAGESTIIIPPAANLPLPGAPGTGEDTPIVDPTMPNAGDPNGQGATNAPIVPLPERAPLSSPNGNFDRGKF